MSSHSSENDTQLIIDLSSHNIASRLNDSLVDSNRALYSTGMQDHAITDENHIRYYKQRGNDFEKEEDIDERCSTDKLLLSPRDQEAWRRSMNLSPVTSNVAGIPTVTIIGGDNAKQSQNHIPLPYMTDFDAFQLAQERNNRKRRQVKEDPETWVDMFTRWSAYSSKKFQALKPPRRHRSLQRNHSSVRRKDFSVKSELSKYNKNKKFIFHRGFSQRSKSNNSMRRNTQKRTHFRKRSRFQNEQELMSYMTYISVNKMDITEVVTAESIRMFLYSKNSLNNILINPSIRPITVPLKQFNDYLHRSKVAQQEANIIRRTSISSKLPTRHRGARRSSTLPLHRRSIAEKLNPELYQIWNAYLKTIIKKRIDLRLSCLLAEDLSSFTSSIGQSSPILRAAQSSISQLGSPTNPIVIPDDVSNENCITNEREDLRNTECDSGNDTEGSNTRPTTSVFSLRQSVTSADQNRRSFFFPSDHRGMNKIDEERSIRSVTSRNTLA